MTRYIDSGGTLPDLQAKQICGAEAIQREDKLPQAITLEVKGTALEVEGTALEVEGTPQICSLKVAGATEVKVNVEFLPLFPENRRNYRCVFCQP